MADELANKIAYFQEQELLDISDDETGFTGGGNREVERALADTRVMAPPPPLQRQRSSFLGPTPRQRQAEFREHSKKERDTSRRDEQVLARASTAPENGLPGSFRSATTNARSSSITKLDQQDRARPFPSSDSSSISALPETPFYKEYGVVPRELKNGKNVKSANNIKIEPPERQLLKGKIVYYYPNDDISMARRQRIHKIIELGAAWVTTLRDDVTHIMVDSREPEHTYTRLLKHLTRAGLPQRITLVKFDPYIPECIFFQTLVDPTSVRFLVKGAPRGEPVSGPTAIDEPSLSGTSSAPSQTSLQVKPSRRQLAAQGSPKTDSVATEQQDIRPKATAQGLSSSPPADIVKDSFEVRSPVEISESPDQVVPEASGGLFLAIREVKATAHLPLDEDDDDVGAKDAALSSEDESGTDVEEPAPAWKRQNTPKYLAGPESRATKGFNQSTFQCMEPGISSTSSQNPNARTIRILEEMCKYYDQTQDHWRTYAYRRGLSTLRKQTSKINSREEAEALPFIGSKLAEKIEEIVLTDRLRKLDNTLDDPLAKNLGLFLDIYGVGLVQANKWISAGHRTLKDLVEKVKLTPSQKIGIEHYEDFAARIPRAEVAAHGDYVKAVLRRLDPECKVTVMGSYRRGAKTSGDIDLIITKPAATLSTLQTVVFHSLVPQLFMLGFLKASLATSRRNDELGTKWLGASCLPSSSTWRRLDLLLVPEEELGAALIYFTGNDIFNRSMRLLASKKGMRLNQRGLYKDVIRGKNREKVTEGTLVEGRSEKKIFEILGVPWREPHERIC